MWELPQLTDVTLRSATSFVFAASSMRMASSSAFQWPYRISVGSSGPFPLTNLQASRAHIQEAKCPLTTPHCRTGAE